MKTTFKSDGGRPTNEYEQKALKGRNGEGRGIAMPLRRMRRTRCQIQAALKRSIPHKALQERRSLIGLQKESCGEI